MSRKVPFPSLQLQKPFSGKGNKNQRSLWADLLSHTVWLLAVEQQEEKKEAFSIQCQGIKGIWDELTDYFVTEFLNKVKSCELEQLTDGLETQLSVVLYMNSNKVAVKEADCAPADLPRAWQNGSLVFIGALGHKWHSTCCTSGNAGDNKTSFWKAFQKTLFPFDWLISDWLQHKNFIEKVWIRWGYNPVQSGLMPAYPFDSSEAWVAAWWGICSLDSQGLQLLHTLVSEFMSRYTKKISRTARQTALGLSTLFLFITTAFPSHAKHSENKFQVWKGSSPREQSWKPTHTWEPGMCKPAYKKF